MRISRRGLLAAALTAPLCPVRAPGFHRTEWQLVPRWPPLLCPDGVYRSAFIVKNVRIRMTVVPDAKGAP